MNVQVFPRVFEAGKTQTVQVYCESETAPLFIKIQPMEIYAIPHTSAYRVDEETRYSFLPLTTNGQGRYEVSYV